MNCTRCGAPLIDGTAYCGACGAPVAGDATQRDCQRCGAPNASDATYCLRCGARLAEQQPGPQIPNPDDRHPPRLPARPDAGPARPVLPAAVAAAGQPAGFWIRVLAYVLDVFVLDSVALPLFLYRGTMMPPYVLLLVWLAYLVAFWVWMGRTPGQALLRLRVVRVDGSPLSPGRAVVRYVGMLIAFFLMGVPFLFIGADQLKQGIHDKMAGTFVIRVRRQATGR